MHAGPEGILLLELRGQLEGVSDTEAMYDSVVPVLSARTRALLLIDAYEFGPPSLSARWALAMRMKQNPSMTERTACVGLRPSMDLVARIIIRASGRTNIKLFRDRQDAMWWLLEGATHQRAVGQL